MENKPFSPEEYRNIYSRVPRLTIEVVIETPEGVVLTLRKKDGWEGQWHLPGMTMLYGETVNEAVARVAAQETGVTVVIQRLLGYIEYPSEQKERGFGRTVGLVFLCSIASGVLQVNEDASDIRVFSEFPEKIVLEQRKFLESHLLVRE